MNNLVDMKVWRKEKSCLPTLIAPDITVHYNVFYSTWIVTTRYNKYAFDSLADARSFGNWYLYIKLSKTQKLKR